MKTPLPLPTPTALQQTLARATSWLVLAGGIAFGGSALAQGTPAKPADSAASAPAAAAASAPAQGAAAAAAPAAATGPKGGDAKAGATKVAMCIGCHNISGYQASFPEIYKVPKIAGQGAAYIVSALSGYRKGERKHPTMRAIATTLTDQDMADIGAYYEQLGKEGGQGTQAAAAKPEHEPSPQVAKLLAQANCASCHGANFAAPIDPTYPKLAGQYADYLYVALKAYQTDKNRYVGRNNAIMMGMARPFTHAELKAMSNYLASLPSELKTVQQTQFR